MRKLFAALLLLLPSLVLAQPPKKAQAEVLTHLQEVGDKLEHLAEAIPADKYGWRPGPGVRSIGEVYAHVAGSNFVLATFLGKQPPADLPADFEKITDKAKILAELHRSFEHVRAAAKAMTEADFDKPVNMFGKNTTQRDVLLTINEHAREHLGQSIAYARVNGVIPPWSSKE